jgi:hypothetical protein
MRFTGLRGFAPIGITRAARIRYLDYRLSHIKLHRVIGRRRITIQPPPSGLVKFNM